VATRQSVFDSDFWVVHPLVATGSGADRMYLWDIDQELSFTKADFLAASEVWFLMPTGTLSGFQIEETTRSLADGTAAEEYIVFQGSKAAAELLLSPSRIDYKIF